MHPRTWIACFSLLCNVPLLVASSASANSRAKTIPGKGGKWHVHLAWHLLDSCGPRVSSHQLMCRTWWSIRYQWLAACETTKQLSYNRFQSTKGWWPQVGFQGWEGVNKKNTLLWRWLLFFCLLLKISSQVTCHFRLLMDSQRSPPRLLPWNVGSKMRYVPPADRTVPE